MPGPRRLRSLLTSWFVVLVVPGCARGLDMGSAYDAKRPAATIPYAGVREETRQYPDYNPIKANILAESADATKKGRPH